MEEISKPDLIELQAVFEGMESDFLHLATLSANHLNGREIALAKTKMEEAGLWITRALAPNKTPIKSSFGSTVKINGQLVDLTEAGPVPRPLVDTGKPVQSDSATTADHWRSFLQTNAQNGLKVPVVDSYPTGIVNGPCICGSWPGGECCKCEKTTATDNGAI